ncbi:hypothetical protein [Streptomyces sp. NPDC088816]|uniref:hypothetical protein n=1 Tax=Streptomyces sp. NPDC088816 TaxID=3365906 RepID=UPI0038222DA4
MIDGSRSLTVRPDTGGGTRKRSGALVDAQGAGRGDLLRRKLGPEPPAGGPKPVTIGRSDLTTATGQMRKVVGDGKGRLGARIRMRPKIG